MSQENEEWELSKENIRPIKQGRKQKILKVALNAHPEDAISQQRQSFENELRTYSGEDPLSVWCEYIKWVEQNFPKGGREGHIKELIERCLSVLRSEKKYFNDDRFIDIILSYAVIGGKPIDVYNYMFSNKIGCKSAKLFINWSWELEQMSNLKKADEILKEGIQRKAEPYEKICSYYKDFEIRLASKIKTNIEQDDCETENSRSAFAMLKPQKKNLAPILRTGEAIENKTKPLLHGRQQPLPKSINASLKVPFKIFDAENVDSSLPVQSRCIVPSDLTSENYKENERKPTKWNKVKVKAHGIKLKTPSDVTPSFKFHCDDEVQPQLKTPRSVPMTSKILTTRCRTPPSPMAFFEPQDPLSRNMYPKNKIYGGAEEYSLEEIRAAEWFDNQKKIEQKELFLEEKMKKEVECLSRQFELLENNSQDSVFSEFKTEINHSKNLLYENGKFDEKLNTGKLLENCKSSCSLIKNDSNFTFECNLNMLSKSNSTINSFDSADSKNYFKTDKIAKNLFNPSQNHSVNKRSNLTSDNKYNKEFLAVSSPIPFDLKEADKLDQIQSTSKENSNNLPFTFYHDN